MEGLRQLGKPGLHGFVECLQSAGKHLRISLEDRGISLLISLKDRRDAVIHGIELLGIEPVTKVIHLFIMTACRLLLVLLDTCQILLHRSDPLVDHLTQGFLHPRRILRLAGCKDMDPRVCAKQKECRDQNDHQYDGTNNDNSDLHVILLCIASRLLCWYSEIREQ